MESINIKKALIICYYIILFLSFSPENISPQEENTINEIIEIKSNDAGDIDIFVSTSDSIFENMAPGDSIKRNVIFKNSLDKNLRLKGLEITTPDNTIEEAKEFASYVKIRFSDEDKNINGILLSANEEEECELIYEFDKDLKNSFQSSNSNLILKISAIETIAETNIDESNTNQILNIALIIMIFFMILKLLKWKNKMRYENNENFD